MQKESVRYLITFVEVKEQRMLRFRILAVKRFFFFLYSCLSLKESFEQKAMTAAWAEMRRNFSVKCLKLRKESRNAMCG